MMKISRSMCRYENRKGVCGDEVLGKFNKKQQEKLEKVLLPCLIYLGIHV
jgi:hypothetical protein